MLFCVILDLIVGGLNLYFKWFSMEYVTMGFLTLLALPLFIPPFGKMIGLSPFWK
jgi:hypothetical protein